MGEDLLDFNERCRLCIEPKRLSIDIFSEEGRRIKLENKINKHLSLKISQTDGFPNQICYQCLYRLETWVSFKQLCTERDLVMKTWSQTFTKNKVNKVKEPSPSSSKKSGTEKRKSSHKQVDSVFGTQRMDMPSTEKASLSQDTNVPIIEEPMLFKRSSYEVEISEKLMEAEVIALGGKALSNNNLQQTESLSKFVLDDLSSNVVLASDNYHVKKDHMKKKSRKQKSAKKSHVGAHMCQDITLSPVDGITVMKDEMEQVSPVLSNIEQRNLKGSLEKPFQANGSPPPLKRKRGRPSKAFLQLERQYKRLKEKEAPRASDPCPLGEMVNCHVLLEKDQDLAYKTEPLEASQVTSEELKPVINEETGVTEIVLNDPDFGSMKFTLSVVGLDSPIPSPPSFEDYRQHPEHCELKADFEGFDCSEIPQPSVAVEPQHPSSEMLSRSLTDVRFTDDSNSIDNIHSKTNERKRSSSTSGDFYADYDLLTTGSLLDVRTNYISKSLENLNSSAKGCSKKHSYVNAEDRMAHSDGEIMEM